jgi:hypothetical protein
MSERKNMSDRKSMLCVGGPRAGKRYTILHGSGFVVPVSEDLQSDRPASIELRSYRAEVFHTPQGDVSFWVPAGQTPLETITLLLETYERAIENSRTKPRIDADAADNRLTQQPKPK